MVAVRLDRLLSNQGLCTRTTAKSFLARNRVLVHGRRPRSLAEHVRSDAVTINGEPLAHPDLLHIVLHKPVGYVCSRERDTPETRIIYDLLPPTFLNRLPPLVCAGRLDKWASGLTVLSQDGALVQRIASPKWRSGALGKAYEVELQRSLNGTEVQAFASGEMQLRSESKTLRPARLEVVDEAARLVRITLFEGRYHQLRRMLAVVGNRSVSIKRVSVGPLTLSTLPEGAWRTLTDEELASLGVAGKGKAASGSAEPLSQGDRVVKIEDL